MQDNTNTDFVNSGNVKIYPTPAKDFINIAISNYTGDLNIEMYDINGRLVKTTSFDFTGNYSLDLNGLSTGVYVVKLSGNDLNYSEKLVVN